MKILATLLTTTFLTSFIYGSEPVYGVVLQRPGLPNRIIPVQSVESVQKISAYVKYEEEMGEKLSLKDYQGVLAMPPISDYSSIEAELPFDVREYYHFNYTWRMMLSHKEVSKIDKKPKAHDLSAVNLITHYINNFPITSSMEDEADIKVKEHRLFFAITAGNTLSNLMNNELSKISRNPAIRNNADPLPSILKKAIYYYEMANENAPEDHEDFSKIIVGLMEQYARAYQLVEGQERNTYRTKMFDLYEDYTSYEFSEKMKAVMNAVFMHDKAQTERDPKKANEYMIKAMDLLGESKGDTFSSSEEHLFLDHIKILHNIKAEIYKFSHLKASANRSSSQELPDASRDLIFGIERRIARQLAKGPRTEEESLRISGSSTDSIITDNAITSNSPLDIYKEYCKEIGLNRLVTAVTYFSNFFNLRNEFDSALLRLNALHEILTEKNDPRVSANRKYAEMIKNNKNKYEQDMRNKEEEVERERLEIENKRQEDLRYQSLKQAEKAAKKARKKAALAALGTQEASETSTNELNRVTETILVPHGSVDNEKRIKNRKKAEAERERKKELKILENEKQKADRIAAENEAAAREAAEIEASAKKEIEKKEEFAARQAKIKQENVKRAEDLKKAKQAKDLENAKRAEEREKAKQAAINKSISAASTNVKGKAKVQSTQDAIVDAAIRKDFYSMFYDSRMLEQTGANAINADGDAFEVEENDEFMNSMMAALGL
ncbi:MAG: hypothetical protein V4544_05565 [Pseudomonadota bacterium]